MVNKWDPIAKMSLGIQLINAADAIGSNIAEGSGKGSYPDFRRYIKISRGSLYETKHWLRRAYARKLMNEAEINVIKPILDELLPKINGFINYLNSKIDD